MGQYLCISASFLAGQYHGGEWPPAPARLFQALLAGSRTGAYNQSWKTVEPGLRALQAMPAPEIVALRVRPGREYRIAVPNNDGDKAARHWARGREYDAAKLRTMKTVAGCELPAPNGHAHVHFLWSAPEPAPITEIRTAAHHLHTFGWGIDMAYADASLIDEQEKRRLISQEGYSHYVPSTSGQLLNVPVPGYLEDLERAYKHFCERITTDGVDPDTRATRYGHQRYRRSGTVAPAYARFALRSLGPGTAAPYSVPWALGMKVAAWMRHAANRALQGEYPQEFIDSYVLGHGKQGHKSHVSFVPVPSIRTMHGDGAIRRVMVLEPPEGPPPEFEIRRGDVAELLQWKLAPSVLRKLIETGGIGRETEPVCSLVEAGDDGVWHWYLAPSSTVWRSVTPVVLHGFNSRGRKFSPKRTEELLHQAFEESGLPRQLIAELTFQPAPFWPGAEGALAMRVPEHLAKWPRCHVSVRFREPVSGPVLAGIGRHYGIGLFAAAPG